MEELPWMQTDWQGATVFVRRIAEMHDHPGEIWYGCDIAVTRDGSDWRFAPNVTVHISGRNDESAQQKLRKVLKAEIIRLALSLRDESLAIDLDGLYKPWIDELRPRVPIPAVRAHRV